MNKNKAQGDEIQTEKFTFDRGILDWQFWVDHPVAVILLIIASTLISMIGPEEASTRHALFYLGLCIMIAAILFFLFYSIRNRHVPTDADKQHDQIERLEREVAKARRDLEETKKAVAAASPRRLSQEHRQAIIDGIKAFPGQKIKITIMMGDNEAASYGTQFIPVFQAAGWQPVLCYTSDFLPNFSNLMVGVSHDRFANKPCDFAPACTLQTILGRLGISNNHGQFQCLGTCGESEIDLRVAPLGATG